MKLKGEAQKFPGMYIFDSIMRRTFGRSVKLVSYYGPVQMCVCSDWNMNTNRSIISSKSNVREVAHLIVAEKETGQIVAFMGVENVRLEMLFLAPEEIGKGSGRKLVQYGLELYGVREVTVNEQNPDAVGFYEHLGFATYKRTDLDEEGNPYPLLYMRSEERERGE